MGDQTEREQQAEEAAVKAERNREWWRDVPEPPELVEQCEKAAADREHAAVRCVSCGQPRSAHGWKASEGVPGCRFVEPGAGRISGGGHVGSTDPHGPMGPSHAERQEGGRLR